MRYFNADSALSKVSLTWSVMLFQCAYIMEKHAYTLMLLGPLNTYGLINYITAMVACSLGREKR